MPKMVRSAGPHLLVVAVAAAMLTVGCGKGNLLESSTGPSSTLSSSALLNDVGGDSAATASRVGEADALAKGGNGQGNSGDKKPADDDGQRRSHEAKVVGFVSARDGDTLTVNGISVVPGTNAIIRHGHRVLTTGDIEAGDHVQAKGAMDGDKLVATEIKVEDTGSDNDDEDGEDDG